MRKICACGQICARGPVAHLAARWDEYAAFVPAAARAGYLAAMRRDGVWGDELALRAFADARGARVEVRAAADHARVIARYGDRGATHVVAFGGAHYDALVPA